MKELNRKDITYRIHELPRIKTGSFEYKKEIGFTGSIFCRKLIGGGPLNHFAFFYGFDETGNLWMLENNHNGVECVSWRDFMSEAKDFAIIYFEQDASKSSEIILRAAERSKYEYCVSENNCEHFVNYCVNGKFQSFQVDFFKQFVDALIQNAEVEALFMKSPSTVKSYLDGLNKTRELLKVKRNNNKLSSMLDSKLKSK